MKTKYSYILTPRSLSITINNRQFSFTSDHPNWNTLVRSIKDRKWARVERIVDIAKSFKKFTHGKVEVKNGEVLYKGAPVHNIIVNRILRMRQEGNRSFRPLVRFLDNLMQNPLESARDELYLFMEHGDLPITEDGAFLAFKRVGENYKDIYSGKFDNHPGKTVRMKRADVNPDRYQTCSYGLHFCSESYLSSYSGARVVILKINPRDVVAIPSDYNNAKGRTCSYKVVGELGVNYSSEDMKRAIMKASVKGIPLPQ